MDVSRMLVAICGFALSVCLFFSIGALSSLRHAVAESHAVKEEAEEVVEKLENRLEELEQTTTQPEALPTIKEDPKDDTVIKEEPALEEYRICAVNQVIGVYNENGDLLRLLDIPIDHLPRADREMLQVGIKADSWQAVETFLQDYEG